MRKVVISILFIIFVLCSCNTNNIVSFENKSSISISSEMISRVSSKSTTSTASKATYINNETVLNFYDIPTENGDEIYYSTAIKIGDRIYAGSKNKVISFNEDLSDIQVLYEYPNKNYFMRSILQFDEKTISVCFSDEVFSFLPDYKYQIIDIYDKSVQNFKSESRVFYPFKRLNYTYYFTESPVENWCDLYDLNYFGNNIFLTSIDNFLIYQKGVYLVDEPYNKENDISIIYYYDFEAQEINKVMEISNLSAIRISGNYVLYSIGSHDKAYLYDIVHKTTKNLNRELGFEFLVSQTLVKEGHILIYDKVKGYEQYNILDINMADLTITEADKTNLPGYIGEWRYYNLVPHTLGNEDLTEEDSFTLQRSTWDGAVQFVY